MKPYEMGKETSSCTVGAVRNISEKPIFRRPAVASILFLLSVIGYCVKEIVLITPADRIEYVKMISHAEGKENQPLASEVKQSRENVSKDIFVTKKGERMQISIKSAASDLCLEPIDGKIQVIEHLEDVRCDMQEKSEGPGELGKVVRTLKSDTATYYYHKDKLIADQVYIKQTDPVSVPIDDNEKSSEPEVRIEQEFGTVKARKLQLLPSESGGKSTFPLIRLKEHVTIHLKDGGELFCHDAEIDCNHLTGRFTGVEDRDFVIYTENRKETSSSQNSLTVKGRRMNVLFKKNETDKEANIKEMTAEKEVFMSYHDDITATGDRAVYRRHHSESPSKANEGVVTLLSEEEGGVCRMADKNGHEVKAKEISFDTRTRILNFIDPIGSLKVDHSSVIDFTSDTLDWDHEAQILYLKKNIKVKDRSALTLINDDVMAVHHTKHREKSKISKITAEGLTEIIYDDQTNLSHHLTCKGNVVADHLKSQITLTADSGTQVHFQDGFGQLGADKAVIDYAAEGKLKPVKMTLYGKVSMINRLPGGSTAESKGVQYALSDKAVYDPVTCKLKLFAKKGKRVLVYDKLNNLQVSAPTLTIHRDKKTGKETIKGSGDVRFTFKQQELELIKKRMSDEGL